VFAPNWALAELDAAYPLELNTWPSLEAQVAAISDDIAYDNHDIDDGLRAGFLTLDELLEQPFIAAEWRQVEAKFPGAPRDRQLRELVRSQIGFMVNDVIEETRRLTQGMARRRLLHRHHEPDPQVGAHGAAAGAHPPAPARAVTGELFAAFAQQPGLMSSEWRDSLPVEEPKRSRHIADYIAGMTDRFAMDSHARIFGRRTEGLSNV